MTGVSCTDNIMMLECISKWHPNLSSPGQHVLPAWLGGALTPKIAYIGIEPRTFQCVTPTTLPQCDVVCRCIFVFTRLLSSHRRRPKYPLPVGQFPVTDLGSWCLGYFEISFIRFYFFRFWPLQFGYKWDIHSVRFSVSKSWHHSYPSFPRRCMPPGTLQKDNLEYPRQRDTPFLVGEKSKHDNMLGFSGMSSRISLWLKMQGGSRTYL